MEPKQLIQSAFEIWQRGGLGMWALGFVSLVLYGMAFNTWIALWEKSHRVPEKIWKGWILNPSEGKGAIGRMIQVAMSSKTIRDVRGHFNELRAAEVSPFNRQLTLIKTFVSAAPLIGLLGTVSGMLVTFAALSAGSGGDKTMDQIAGGISEALITTQTGLVVALPGYFVHYHLMRNRDKYASLLAHLETQCSQAVHRRLSKQNKEEEVMA